MTATSHRAGRIVVLGDLMVDVVATTAVPLVRGSDAPAVVRRHGGGSGANVAAWLGALWRDAGGGETGRGGVAVGGGPAPGAAASNDGVCVLLACVGDDEAGRAGIRGVDVRAAIHPHLPTGTCITLVEPDGERTFLPDRGANAALRPDDLPHDVFRAGDHLHLSAYPLLEDTPARAAALEALTRARAAGMTVSVDPASSAPLRAVGASAFLAWTAGVDTLLPNADEAHALTGEAEPVVAARALAAASGAEVVLTLGAGGALWTDGNAVVRAAGPAVAGALDSTGAGDAFTAGWLTARRAGASVEAALRAANALGARAVAGPGGRPA